MFDKRIITIHDLAEDTMLPSRLEKIIRTALLLGYQFVSMDEILNHTTRGLKLCLTVDDAYRSTVETILPIIERHNIISTLFIPTGLLGYKANSKILLENDCYRNKDMMTWADVKEWIRRGQNVGFHTHKHFDLYHHTDAEIKDDFEQGMVTLSEQNISVKYFAYPKGFLPKNRRFIESLFAKHGIEYAFTVNRGEVNPNNPYYIHRTLLGNKEPFLWSICKVVGIEDLHYYKIKQKRNRAVVE